jgi:hypothetical protein
MCEVELLRLCGYGVVVVIPGGCGR